jgi:AcrR family transcriptional regulator
VEATRANARARILDAAVLLIAREGIDDVRIARIAMQAGVSPSLLHYHFASRDSLLAEALEHAFELAGDVRTNRAEQPRAAADRLRWMIDWCLPQPDDTWMLWVELWLHAGRHPELRPTAARLYARMHSWFDEAIEEGEAHGAFRVRDRTRTVDHLLALLDGYGIRTLIGDFSVERARDEIWLAIAPELGLQRSASR